MNLLLGVSTLPFASMRSATATNSRTIFALAHLNRLVAHEATITVRLIFWPSILRTSRRREHGSSLTLAFFSTDRFTQASTSSCPFPYAPLANATKSCCSRGVTFPLMHDSCTPTTWHPCKFMSFVNLIDGVVCAGLRTCDCVTNLLFGVI